jgi:zinc protease
VRCSRGVYGLALPLALTACTPLRVVTPLHYEQQTAPPDATTHARTEETFRSTPPPIVPVVEAVDPSPESFVMANGLRVLFVPRHGVPIVESRFVAPRGSVDIDDAGSLAVMQTMDLFRGSGDDALRKALEAVSERDGGYWGTGAGSDEVWAYIKTSSSGFEASLDLLDRVVTARIEPGEYGRRLAEWQRRVSKLAASLSNGERWSLFGSTHAYGYVPLRSASLSQEQAQRLHDRLFQPRDATLIIVGDLSREAAFAGAERAFAGWVGAGTVAAVTTPPPEVHGPRIAVIVRHDLQQVNESVFARGPVPRSPDFVAFAVIAELLGGYGSSRLVEELRESGAGYSPSSFVSVEREASWVSCRGAFDKARAIDAVRRTLAAVERLRDDGVTPDELTTAREALLADWRWRLASVDGAAHAFEQDVWLGVDRARSFPEDVMKVTRQDIARVASAYLRPDALHVLFDGNDDEIVVESLGMGAPMRISQSK